MVAAGTADSSIRLWRSYLHRLSRVCPKPALATRDILIAWLARPDWQPETRKSARTALVSFFGWAERAGLIQDNPAGHLPRIHIPAAEPRPASEEAIRDALLAADPRVRLMVLLGCVAGLRRAEIAGIHHRDLTGGDLEVRGKGGRRRVVSLPPDLAEAVRMHPGWLFPSPDGHLSPAHVGVLIGRALPDGTTPHMLRHAAASDLHAMGVPLVELREFLGHANLSTTQRYVFVRRERTAAAMVELRGRYG